MARRFRDRRDAGRQLAATMKRNYAGRDNLLVLALPRGGVPVGATLARELGAPLDVLVVRKLGVPGQEELAMGALAMGGIRVLNPSVVQTLDIPDSLIESTTQRERAELERREKSFRGDKPFPPVQDHTVILVDDGLATGSTMRVGVEIVRKHQPREVVVAVPVAPPSTVASFAPLVDDIVALQTPEPFYAIGLWYDDFHQLSDEDVRRELEEIEREQKLGSRG